MIGVDWLDTVGAVVFAVVALVSIGQLAARWTDIDDRGGVALHAVMAVGMAAMSLPGAGPLSDTAWVVVFGLATAWALGALGRRAWATWHRPAAQRSWILTGGAAHHVLASAVMVVAFGVGHGSHDHDVDVSPVAALRPVGSGSAGAGVEARVGGAADGSAHEAHEGHEAHQGEGDGDGSGHDGHEGHEAHEGEGDGSGHEGHDGHEGHEGHEGDGSGAGAGDGSGHDGHESEGDGSGHEGHEGHEGHGGHAGAGSAGHQASDVATAGVQLSPGVDGAIRAPANWPVVWQLAALAFVVYGVWSVRGGQEAPACKHCAARAQPDDGAGRARRLARAAIGPAAARACAVVMAGGMAAMAFVL